MLEDPASRDVVNWLPEGNGFELTKDTEAVFMRDFLPRLCKSNAMCAFVRQLNGYGFRKRDPRSVAFIHTVFHRDHPEQLHAIKRQQAPKRRTTKAKAAATDGADVASPTQGLLSPDASPTKPPVAGGGGSGGSGGGTGSSGDTGAHSASSQASASAVMAYQSKMLEFVQHSLSAMQDLSTSASMAASLVPVGTADTTTQAIKLQLDAMQARIGTFLQHQYAAFVSMPPVLPASHPTMVPASSLSPCDMSDMVTALNTAVANAVTSAPTSGGGAAGRRGASASAPASAKPVPLPPPRLAATEPPALPIPSLLTPTDASTATHSLASQDSPPAATTAAAPTAVDAETLDQEVAAADFDLLSSDLSAGLAGGDTGLRDLLSLLDHGADQPLPAAAAGGV